MSIDCTSLLGPEGNEPTWLDTHHSAQYLQISVRSLERFRFVGGGPRYAKAGRKVLYRRDWLDHWLEGRSFTSTAAAKRSGIR
jgi:hypothetical protein